MKISNFKLILSLTFVLVICLQVATSTYAANSPKPTPTPSPKVNLAAICQSHQVQIKQNLFNTVTLAQAMLTQIDGINTRAISHYSLITVPSKKALNSFETIESSLTNKRNTIDAFLKASATSIVKLSCSSPSAMNEFTQVTFNLQQTLNMLSEYKTDTRNLITAIIALDKGSLPETPAPTPSLTPSLTPTPSPSSTATSTPRPTSSASPSPSARTTQPIGANGQ